MTTSSIFDAAISCADDITRKFNATGNISDTFVINTPSVTDIVFESSLYRRAHISIVDARESKKLWLLHVTVFPHVHNPAPIYGFDIVAGPTRVSGAFHDFSWCGSNDVLMPWFAQRTQDIKWNKKRDLPDWATKIFSNNIVAIGAVGIDELKAFTSLGLETLEYYLTNLGKTNHQNVDVSQHQNNYCYYQKQNPHTPRVLVNLGFTEESAEDFIDSRLFPKIKHTHK